MNSIQLINGLPRENSVNWKKMALGMVSVFICTVAFAGKPAKLAKAAKAAKTFKPVVMPAFPNDPVMDEALTSYPDEAEFNKVFADWQNLKRAPASASFGENDLTPGFKEYRTELLQVKSADQLEAFIKKYNGKYDQLDPHTQYFVAQLVPFQIFRGILWKLRPIVETGIVGGSETGSRATHSAVVSALRATAANIEAYLPTDQWRAGFQYIAEPTSSMSKADQFSTMSQFQAALVTKLAPLLAQTALRLSAILKKMPANKVFAWDSKINYGSGSFDDGLNRYIGHGQAEVRSTYAMVLFQIHNVFVWSSYNVDALPKVEGEIGKLYGIDGFFPGQDLGVTSQDRITKLKEFQQAGFMAFDNTNGPTYMLKAGGYLRKAVDAAVEVQRLLNGRNGDPAFALNPIFFRNEASPLLGKGVDKLKNLLKGPGEVHSGITGETVTVNLAAFYSQPPSNLPKKSLMDLLPSAFDTSGQPEPEIKNEKGEVLKYRNYLRGRPIGWENDTWSTYIPSAAGKEPGYMAMANRVLRSSLGTNYFWIPMGYYF